MSIAIIGNSAESMLNFRGSLVRRLVQDGNTVLAFCPDYSDVTRKAVEALGATPVSYKLDKGGTRPFADAMSFVDLYRLLRRYKPKAVLNYFIKPAIYGTLAAACARVDTRIVMVEGLGYGFGEAGRSIKRRMIFYLIRLLLKISLSRSDKVLVLNEEDKSFLEDSCGISGDLVENMGGIGVELDKFKFTESSSRVMKFAMAARLIREKGVREYCEAALALKGEGYDVDFLLLGGIANSPSAIPSEEIEYFSRAGIILWPGQVSNIGVWLSEADVFVLPSYYREGVPRSIQEAMALGRAIITTDHVGCRDTVESGVNGILVGVRNHDELVGAMRLLLDTPGLARMMGRESRRLAEERFDARRADRFVANLLVGDER